ncbi:ABC transporter substrate-binding protein [Frankia sp. EAN1pec]|uniref:ABC transporter substrate-binding protein n=1 Tax=Parafrankia sp. (strain EAN1pec) TaxID=298653 RepID=UPI0002D936FF
MVAALAAVILAACGSGSGSGSSAGGGIGTAKGDPIVVGTICSCSGAQAASTAKVKDVAQVWAESVNARGGINGHPVKMIVEDDAGDPAKALRAAKKLVEQDHVVAIVGQMSLADATWADYTSKKGVPVVGGISATIPYLTEPTFFASGTTLPALVAGTLLTGKEAGKTKLGVLYCSESPSCSQLDLFTKAAAGIVGGIIVTSAKISSTAPNYTAPCLGLKRAGVDSITLSANNTVVARVMEACAQQGLHPTMVSQFATSAPEWLRNPNFEGALLTSQTAVPVASAPAGKEFLDAVAKFAPGLTRDPQFTPATILAWAGGKLFEAAAKAGGVGPNSTPTDVMKGLYTLKNETLGGLAPPLTFTKGKPAVPTCYFTTQIHNGEYILPDGPAPKCLTPSQVEAFGKLLAG